MTSTKVNHWLRAPSSIHCKRGPTIHLIISTQEERSIGSYAVNWWVGRLRFRIGPIIENAKVKALSPFVKHIFKSGKVVDENVHISFLKVGTSHNIPQEHSVDDR